MGDILFVTTYDPDCESLGGASWIDRRIISALRLQFDVDVVYVASNGDLLDHVALEIKHSSKAKFRTLLRMVTTSEPYFFAKFKSDYRWRDVVARVSRHARSTRYVVTSQTPALLACRDAGIAPTLHIAHNRDAVLSYAHDPLLLRFLRNGRRTRRSESLLVAKARMVWALSLTDATNMRKDGIDCCHIGSLVTQGLGRRERCGRIGFIGKFDWPPNREALNVLLQNVVPMIRDRLGEQSPTLVVAGRGSEVLGSVVGVDVLGEVDSAAEFYRGIDLVAIPRMGISTGVSVKMLEAIDCGTMVIAPRLLASDAGVYDFVIIADSAEEISEQIVEFYRSTSSGPEPDDAKWNENNLATKFELFFAGLENGS